MMFTISCGPSAEEKAALEKPISEKIKNDGMQHGVAYAKIIHKEGEIYHSVMITRTLTEFKKENPKIKVISFDVQYSLGGSSNICPDGILINFEPKESQTSEKQPEWMDNLVEGTVSIPKGGTLCGTLGMTEKEALNFAKANKIKYWYEGKILKVDIQPEDWINFKTRVVKEWKKVKPFYHNRGHS